MATRCAERISERRTRHADSLRSVGAEGRDFLSQPSTVLRKRVWLRTGWGPGLSKGRVCWAQTWLVLLLSVTSWALNIHLCFLTSPLHHASELIP